MALTKSDRPWLLTALAVAVSLGFAVSNATRSAEEAWMVLDFASRIIGPLGAACIAWLGVSQTLDNSQKLDRVKEWHTMLRWATDMYNASSEREVEAGIAILDSIDRQSEIPADQHEVIDAILTAVFRNPNTPFEEQR